MWLWRQAANEAPIVVLLALSVVAATGAGALGRSRHGWRATALLAAAALLTAGTGAWIGANSPRATWFGSLVSVGPRDSRTVALTFDDGPNEVTTLAVRDLLDARGVKAAFFEVGKAVDARPDLVRALVDDGHLVGNHSYRHDSIHWLDPRYPELGQTERAIRDDAGVCPAFYRPPHGQHTPFMASVVHRHGMVMVGWDVSAGDWTTGNAQRVADRVLRRVRPGSVIDLHDGLDGNLTADRSVVVRALPLILDGLAAKGLQPVRLDALLGRAGYLSRC